MRITIVIPVYNVEAYIEDCLRSVIAQTYKGEIECVIVDDCTPDGSCDVIEKFIKEYIGNIQFKLLHHDKNRGLSAARNTGIDAATGEYIYFLDSDDEITPDCIELLATPLTKKKYDFVIGDYKTVGSDKVFPPLLLEDGGIYTNKEIRSTYFAEKWYVMAWNKLCNLDFIKKERLYFKEGLINEDNLWSFQLACLAQTMYIAKEQVYLYKVRANSIMGGIDQFKRADAFSTIFYEAHKWATQNNFINEKDIFDKILWLQSIPTNIIFSQESKEEKKKYYLKCYKRLRIAPWSAYKKGFIHKRRLIMELHRFLTWPFGHWYLCLFYRVFKSAT